MGCFTNSEQPLITEALLNSAKEKDEAAMKKIYLATYREIYSSLYISLNGDKEAAKKLLEDIYVYLFENIEQLKSPDNFLDWAKEVLYRMLNDYSF